MPDQGNPQGLDRYAYVANNPITRVDHSGHCWGPASGMQGWTFLNYGTTCDNLDMALTIVKSDEASVGAKIAAGAYVAVEGAAHTALVVGSAACLSNPAVCMAGAKTALGIGGTVAEAACADGDCGNEIVAAGNAAQTAQSVWKLNPFARGNALEKLMGGNLVRNNPVIDFWNSATGIAKSIKSIDLNAATYQNVNNMSSKVLGYVKTLANWSGTQNWNGVQINPGQVQMRELLLVLPPNPTQAQLATLHQLQQTAFNNYNIVMNLVTVK